MKKLLIFIFSILLINFSVLNAKGFDEISNKASQFMKNHQYSSAIFEYKKTLRSYPQDMQARIGLINAYLARASYFANTTKELYKASYDIKSALFYLQYFPPKLNDEQTNTTITQNKEILNKLQAKIKNATSAQEKYKLAKTLRTQGEFAAAAYDFIELSNTQTNLKADCYIQTGDIMNILGLFDTSINYYQLALNENPKKEEIHLKLARVYERAGKIDEAAKAYENIFENSEENSDILYSLENIWTIKAQQQPNSVEAHINLGAIYQKTGKFDLAMQEYEKAQKLEPSNVNVRLNLGTLYQQKKDYETAIAAYDSILTLYPRNEQAILYKAQSLAALNRDDESLENYKQYLALKPNDNKTKTEMLTLLKDKMTPQEILDILYQEVKENPNNPDAYYKFAYELHKANKLDDAIVYYELAIKMNPQMADAYINLAQTYVQKKDNNSAIQTIKKAQNVIKNNAQLDKYYKNLTQGINADIYNNATAIFAKGDFQNAINEYLKIQPATVDSLIGIASAYQSLTNYPKAIEYFQKALQKEPNNAEILYYIALAYSSNNDLNNAKTFIEKAQNIDKNDTKIEELKEYITGTIQNENLEKALELYEIGNYAKALTLLNEILALDNKFAHAYYYKAMILDAQKNYKEAITNYLNALKFTDDLNIAYYSIGIDYDYLQDYKQAINYYKKFLSTEPTEKEYIEFTQNRIKELEPYAK